MNAVGCLLLCRLVLKPLLFVSQVVAVVADIAVVWGILRWICPLSNNGTYVQVLMLACNPLCMLLFTVFCVMHRLHTHEGLARHLELHYGRMQDEFPSRSEGYRICHEKLRELRTLETCVATIPPRS